MSLLNNRFSKKIIFYWIDQAKLGQTIFYREKTKRIISNGNPRIFLLNSPEYANLGDQLINIATKRYLEKNFAHIPIYDISQTHLLKDFDGIKSKLNSDDILLLSGGGFLGNLWLYQEQLVRRIFKEFPGKIIILPQTIYFTNDEDGRKQFEISKEIYMKRKDVFAFARDKASLNVFHCLLGEKCALLPDMSIYLALGNCSEKNKDSNDVGLCMRDDIECAVTQNEKSKIEQALYSMGYNINHINTVLPNNVLYEESRLSAVWQFVSDCRKYKFVITDRLHGMIMSFLAGTPCIALDNKSKKVSGVLNVLEDNFDVRGIVLWDGKEDIYSKVKEVLKLDVNTLSDYQIEKCYHVLGDEIGERLNE